MRWNMKLGTEKTGKERQKRKQSLHMVFIRFLLRFCIGTVLLAAGTFAVYAILANTGAIRLPTDDQTRIEEAADEIRNGGDETELLPDSCRFGVYDSDGHFLYGTFEGREKEEAWERWKTGKTGSFYNYFYRGIEKDDGNLLIVRYQMVAKFANPALRNLFPNAEFLILSIALILFIMQAAVTARSFGRYLKKRLDALTEIAAKAGGEDLNFEREYSDIREVDEVLGALFKMKEALKQSLKEQWESQKRKQEQVAALAHDIKTPLTIIRGNAELIQETEDSVELREWNQEILDNAAEMERYLSMLQEALRVGRQTEEVREKEEFTAELFLEEVSRRAEALGRTKKLKTDCSYPEDKCVLRGKSGMREQLLRAVGNVISNGADYCPEGGTLSIWAEKKCERAEQFLRITVTDSGPGFSPAALRHGTEQFFQADRSRAGSEHYGMGLYIARSILEEYDGKLELDNAEQGGGKVMIYIPCDKRKEGGGK